MLRGSNHGKSASPIGPVVTIVLAFAGVLLLMAFSAISFMAGNPALASTAGVAAIGLIAWAVQRLVKAVFPGGHDDDDLPPAGDQPTAVEVD